MATRPSIPEVAARFAAYHRLHPAWGSLHIVLADGNVGDADVAFCEADAFLRGDQEGRDLACVLMLMSKTQRRKLRYAVPAYTPTEPQPTRCGGTES